jgi:hypothetical protein
MVDTTTSDLFPQELDFRAANGIEVALHWSKPTNRLTITVNDTASGETFTLPVEAHNALDAFHHPYAYAASSGSAYAGLARAA